MINKDSEDKYVKGLYLYDPRYHDKKVPDFILANGSIDIKQFLEWISDDENVCNGKVFFDICINPSTKIVYQKLNLWRYKNGWKPSLNSKEGLDKRILEELTEKYDLPK